MTVLNKLAGKHSSEGVYSKSKGPEAGVHLCV